MKKLLSIVICVLLSTAIILADDAITVTPAVNPANSGIAYVDAHDYKNGNNAGFVSREDTDGFTTTAQIAYSNSASWRGYGKDLPALADLKAENPILGYTFSHWEGPDTYTYTSWWNTYTQSISYTPNKSTAQMQVDFGRTGRDSKASVTITANFRPVISIENATNWVSEKSITITKPKDESESTTITINLCNAEGYKYEKSGSQNVTIATDKSPSITGTDVVKLTIIAEATAQNGETATIIFTSTNNGGKATINVNVETEAEVTFNAPKEDGVKYIATQASTSIYTLTKQGGNEVVQMTNETEKAFKLEATGTTDYRFYRWLIENNGNHRYIYSTPYNYTASNGDQVTAEFIHKDYAQFLVVNNSSENIFFNNLQEACNYAATVNNKNVIVYTSGRVMPGTYTIPANVTLLVPGDNTNTIKNNGLDETDYAESDAISKTPKKYLTLDNGTQITVRGNLCIYAVLSSKMAYNSSPLTYGQVNMGEDCHIYLESGAHLSAYGYITGNPATSSITARPGSSVYEAFQVRDWRGGNATISMLNNTQKVFPVGQYYVQNIETKLRLESGATEYLSFGVAMSVGKIFANTPFVVNHSSSKTGLFKLGDNNSYLEKYYDKATDRMKYDIVGTTDEAIAQLANIKIDVDAGLAGAIMGLDDIDSKGYVLPINMNMDVHLENITIETLYDVAFLAGSTLNIDDKSELIINSNANIYIYDKEQHSSCYFGQYNDPLLSVHFSPTKIKTRTVEELTDARFDVNGLITVNGGLYTTSSGGDITSSKGGGQVHFVKEGTKTSTYQVHQTGNDIDSYVSVPITNAQLHNADGSYSAGNDAADGDRYIYYTDVDGGKWTKPRAAIPSYQLPELTITLPTTPSVSDNLVCKLTKPDGVRNYELTDLDITSDNSNFVIDKENVILTNDQLTIPIIYNSKQEHGNYTANITIKNTQDAAVTLNTSIAIVAKEDYTPSFTTESSCEITSYVGTPNPKTFPITPTTGNVTTLLGDNKIQWSKEIVDVSGDNSVFSFDFGTDANYLSQAAVTFTPKTANSSTATLRLIATCSYVPAGQEPLTVTKEIPLNGTSSLNPNNLAFVDPMPTTFVGMTDIPLFANMGNHANAPTQITITPNNIISYSGNGSIEQPYVINALAAGEVTITATQVETPSCEGANISTTIQVLPAVQWNWDILYYGATHTNPITTSAADWTLELAPDNDELCNEYVQLNMVDGQYQVTIINSPTLEDCTAKFIYTVNGEELHFTSTLSGLRHITACVDDQSRFEAMYLTADNTTFNAGTFTFSSTTTTDSKVTLQFVGMPKTISFTPNGVNKWNVEESANTQDWTPVATWTNYANNQQVVLNLLPTTRYVRISYGAGSDSQGTLQNICIQKLDVTTANSKIYLPIPGNQTIVFTHTGDAITMQHEGLTVNSSTTQVFGGYSQTSVNISATSAGTYTFTATQGAANEVVTVVAYDFPQGLPIKTAEWTEDAKDKYYFYTTETQFAAWNENNQRIILQNPAADEARSITFAFEGAPSIISFEYSQNIVSSEWTLKESVNGIDWVTATGNRTVSGTSFLQELQYTTRYVHLQHKGSWEETYISNLIIEGYPKVLINPEELVINEGTKTGTFTITAINLQNITLELNSADFTLSDNDLTSGEYPLALGVNKVGDITITVTWVGTSIVNEGLVTIKNKDGGAILGYVKLLGAKSAITKGDASQTGIWTGVPNGKYDEAPTKTTYTLQGGHFAAYEYQPVDVTNAFMNTTNGEALFDYLFIYGETTTTDGAATIAIPTSEKGSNAKTPYYIYKKGANGVSYEFVEAVENANSSTKTQLNFEDAATTTDDKGVTYYSIRPLPSKEQLSIYMTGFCPYATTGCTKYDEGVWYIQGNAGQHVHLYLEDCHIYSRNKTELGHPFQGREGSFFTEGYVRGSGAVFVFESQTLISDDIENAEPFEVTIHTRGNNMLKSNYGSFFGLMGMRAFQVSSPIQVHLKTDKYEPASKVTLNFDDIWQKMNTGNSIVDYERTNGFLSLQKQVNNAPSIDLGNKYTTVNFRGGRVELQNAQIVSPNYKTTLAISHRSGEMGGVGLGIKLAYGIGTDAVEGTVNFYDGTTTVLPMYVNEAYRAYYLMDTKTELDGEGNEVTTELTTTSCLRCPDKTYVYGGSHGMLRACNSVTSKGGAPTDGPAGKPLGKYEYNLVLDGETPDVIQTNGLATINNYPNSQLATYHQNAPGYENQRYGMESVAPDKDNKLYFWVPADYGYDVKPEEDKLLTTWKACMTEIAATYLGKSAAIGGDVAILSDEEVKYLLYCKLDKGISDVITATGTVEAEVWEDDNEDGIVDDGEVKVKEIEGYTYAAPVKDPSSQLDETYFTINPSYVGQEYENQVTNEGGYSITDRVYYITTALADTWMNFTMPFDVENIYIVETFSESVLEDLYITSNYDTEKVLEFQAKQNADFAAFFAMAMALGSDKAFEKIFEDYKDWAYYKDSQEQEINGNNQILYTGVREDYDLRGWYPLEHFDGTNFMTAQYYLYKNMGDWTLSNAPAPENQNVFTTQWQVVPKTQKVLMEKGEVYSMMFPYCTGCDERGWDYWSGKFLIFESTKAGVSTPHEIAGKSALENEFAKKPSAGNTAYLTGNHTFAHASTESSDVYTYVSELANERYEVNQKQSSDIGGGAVDAYPNITPTTSFMVANITPHNNMPAVRITRDGKITYGGGANPDDNPDDGTLTGGHMPTIGAGNALFITSVSGGINISVAQPQYVRVISTTGSTIFNGYITTSTNVQLPMDGVYVIAGETEVHKIFY